MCFEAATITSTVAKSPEQQVLLFLRSTFFLRGVDYEGPSVIFFINICVGVDSDEEKRKSDER